MARVLIVYGTTDGHTARIAHVIGDVFRDQGWTSDIEEARDAWDVHPEGYDRIIVAASIHIGGYQRAVKRWVTAHAEALNRTRSAFVSVCLGVLEPRVEAQHEVQRIAERFLHETGWQPTVTKAVAGAIPYTRYNWIKKVVMRRIAAKASGSTDTSRDFEYTNWEDVRAFAAAFSHQPASLARPALAVL